MPLKGSTMSDEQKLLRSALAKRQHAAGRANTSGLHSETSRAKSRAKMMGHTRTPTGADHHLWKGDEAGYVSKHMWMHRHHTKTGTCNHCNKEVGTAFPTGTEWANISGKYLRDRNDFIELCRSCHRIFDYSKGKQ